MSLVSSLETLLLDYLKWLGIIKTQEREVIKDTGISIIKKFWVTPAGERLIDRMMVYFIQKGKIKI